MNRKGLDTHTYRSRVSRGCVLDHGKQSHILISNPRLPPELQALYLHGYPVDISTYSSIFPKNTSNSELDFSVGNPHHCHHQTNKTGDPSSSTSLSRSVSQIPHPVPQPALWSQTLRSNSLSHLRHCMCPICKYQAWTLRLEPSPGCPDSLSEGSESRGRSSAPGASIHPPVQPLVLTSPP